MNLCYYYELKVKDPFMYRSNSTLDLDLWKSNSTQNDCIDIGQLTMESLTSVCLISEDNITDFLIPTQIILAFLPWLPLQMVMFLKYGAYLISSISNKIKM